MSRACFARVIHRQRHRRRLLRRLPLGTGRSTQQSLQLLQPLLQPRLPRLPLSRSSLPLPQSSLPPSLLRWPLSWWSLPPPWWLQRAKHRASTHRVGPTSTVVHARHTKRKAIALRAASPLRTSGPPARGLAPRSRTAACAVSCPGLRRGRHRRRRRLRRTSSQPQRARTRRSTI